MNDLKRPDLVFVMSDAGVPHRINVIELKSPSLPLTNAHLSQLEGYMAKIENYCQNELHRQVTVHGYLLVALPDVKTVADAEILPVNRMKKAGPEPDRKRVELGTSEEEQ